MNWELFSGFLLITIVLLLTPEPIVMLVISTGATWGIRAALVTVAGTSTGNAVLLAAIALGLGWVVKHAAHLFEVLRWAGALYLIWLGIQAWRGAGRVPEAPDANRVHFWRGFAVALSNPKTLAFFTAFLPQFVDPTRPPAYQITLMCGSPRVLATLSDSLWAVASGLGRNWFAQPGRTRLLGRASGMVLLGAGLWLCLARRPP